MPQVFKIGLILDILLDERGQSTRADTCTCVAGEPFRQFNQDMDY